MGVQKDTEHLLAGLKRLEDKYKDPDVLPEVNKADMARMMEFIEEYLRSHCPVMRAPLASVIRKTVTVQTYGNDDEIIARML